MSACEARRPSSARGCSQPPSRRGPMTNLLQDIRYAARRLKGAPWFTAAAVLTLSLAIGANTTVFTLVNAVLIRGLPFENPDEIMSVWMENERGQQSSLSYPNLEDLRNQSQSFQSLAGSLGASVNVSDTEQVAERIVGAYVTANFFDVIGEEPVTGRGFLEEDDRPGAPPVVLIGYTLWQNRYGGDPAVLGETIKVNSLPATVVGIMGPGMRFPNEADVWIPKSNLPPEIEVENRGTRNFSGIGRLAPGVSEERAREEIQAIGARLAEAYPETAEWRPNLMSFQERTNDTEIRIIFLSLFGAVVFVLLIACANVGNLLLARSAQRSREIAVRVSLGATRGRIVRQLLVESLLLALMAGAFGLGLAVLGVRWFDANTQDVGKPYWMDFTFDGIVFGFIAFVCLATVLFFGLAPALNVSRTDVNEVLKEGGRSGSAGMRARRWTSTLVVGELVLTLVLLSGAMFMMRSFMSLYRMDTGFDTQSLLTMQMYLPLTKYPEPGPRQQLFENLERRLGDEAALEASTLATVPPVSGGAQPPLQIEGGDEVEPELRPVVTLVTVGDRYFETLDLPLIQGRVFGQNDGDPGSETVIVNQRFADLHFEGDALGRRIRLGVGATGDEEPWLTIVGIAPNVRQAAIEEREPDPVAYQPLRANPARSMGVLVRTRADRAAATAAVREALRGGDPDLPVFNIMTMDERLAQQRWPFRTFGLLFSIFAVIALVLSGVGLYSVTAYSVAQRTQEFGIRMSLGAKPRDISWLALRRGLIHLAIGLPIGLLGAFGVGQLLQGLLAQISPTDPITLISIVLLLGTIAVVACLRPAQRAARLDPMVAFRTE
ncbi:MAG: FtsX-like permease family protein [Gemmatimonas sp.]|nr:FtsX-like permease family protein [Gemmatimonas sp.]